jgi:hypothetical protein
MARIVRPNMTLVRTRRGLPFWFKRYVAPRGTTHVERH